MFQNVIVARGLNEYDINYMFSTMASAYEYFESMHERAVQNDQEDPETDTYDEYGREQQHGYNEFNDVQTDIYDDCGSTDEEWQCAAYEHDL